MKTELQTDEINFEDLSSDELIEYISFKEEFPNEAEKAFAVFCYRFQHDTLKTAEIYSNKYGYGEVVALDVANCAFARVWKYPTFNKDKAKAKNIDSAVKIWLHAIVYNELMKYGVKDTCAEADENDLDIIENIDELITLTVGENIEKKRDLKLRLEILERSMLGLSEKQKIIYLTYKAYENNGKNLPRAVGKKLRTKLNLVQSSIQVYKKEATDHINNYLKSLNGN